MKSKARRSKIGKLLDYIPYQSSPWRATSCFYWSKHHKVRVANWCNILTDDTKVQSHHNKIQPDIHDYVLDKRKFNVKSVEYATLRLFIRLLQSSLEKSKPLYRGSLVSTQSGGIRDQLFSGKILAPISILSSLVHDPQHDPHRVDPSGIHEEDSVQGQSSRVLQFWDGF